MKAVIREGLENQNQRYLGQRGKGGFRRGLTGSIATVALVIGTASSGTYLLAIPLGHGGAKIGRRRPMAASQSAPDSRFRMTVLVYNYAQVSPPLVTRAQEIATMIFEQAGIDTTWLLCPVVQADLKKYPTCDQTPRVTDFALRLLPASMVEKLPDSDNEAIGFAQRCPIDERGCVVNVFYSTVDQLTSEVGAREERILAHVMAHELGHLLLGPNAHSPSGIMRGIWSRDDLRFISWSNLLFTPRQSDKLRANIARRMNMESATSSALLATK
jgi:hypothetical protein